jgi:pimeloyl-ACP methyl ester carboxylesterase
MNLHGFTSAHAQLDEVNLHYVTGGTGPVLVLLHGGFQTWRAWRQIMPTLAEHFTIVAPDLRGIGDSSHPKEGYDQRTVAHDIGLLLDQLGHSEVFVAGHDLGSAITVALAAEQPQRVLRFAFMEYLLCGFGFEEALVPRPDNRSLWFAALNMVPEVPEMLVRGHEREYLGYLMRKALTANPDAIAEEDFEEYVRCYAAPDGWRPLAELFRATWTNAELNRKYAERRLTIPALAIGGEYSAGSYVGDSLKALADDVTSEVLPATGHWLLEEQPQMVAQKLIDFFRA